MAINTYDNFEHYRPGLKFLDSLGVTWMKVKPDVSMHTEGCVVDLVTGEIKHYSHMILPIHRLMLDE